MSTIGEVLDRLTTTIGARKDAKSGRSYTASLLEKGKEHCARKFGEEAVETIIAGTLGHKDELASEAADALYHLAVLLAANGMTLADVAEVLEEREGVSGHDEKANR